MLSVATRWAWSSPASKKLEPEPKHRPDPRLAVTSPCMPYVQGVSEPLNRIIRKSDVVVRAKPTNTIRNMLGSPKDKPDMLDKTGTVYHYSCHECPSHYIGETERPLRKRAIEHKTESSPVGAHSKVTKHSFDPEQTKSWTRTPDGIK